VNNLGLHPGLTVLYAHLLMHSHSHSHSHTNTHTEPLLSGHLPVDLPAVNDSWAGRGEPSPWVTQGRH
jgi:hypothetical protein